MSFYLFSDVCCNRKGQVHLPFQRYEWFLPSLTLQPYPQRGPLHLSASISFANRSIDTRNARIQSRSFQVLFLFRFFCNMIPTYFVSKLYISNNNGHSSLVHVQPQLQKLHFQYENVPIVFQLLCCCIRNMILMFAKHCTVALCLA